MDYNWEIYRLLNPDLKTLKTKTDYVTHFLNIGKRQNRPYNILHMFPDFNWEVYKRNNLDLEKILKNEKIEYEKHYLEFGIEECRLYGDLNKYITYEKSGFLNETDIFIDKILYINLEKRKDRRFFILKEFEKMRIPSKKIKRIEAILNESKGAIGCTMSHIKALEYAISENYENVLILEDDIYFIDNYKKLQDTLHFLKSFDNYDVIQLHSFPMYKDSIIEYNKYLNKSIYTTMGSAYLVKKHFMMILKNNMEEGLKELLKTKDKKYTLDHYWTKLQEKSSWYCLKENIIRQRKSYSDNEGRVVDYTTIENKRYI